MKNVAIVELVNRQIARLVSFPEGVVLTKGSYVRIARMPGGGLVGELLTETMLLDDKAYYELSEYINPPGSEGKYRATAKIEFADKAFGEEKVDHPRRVLRDQHNKYYGVVGTSAEIKDEVGVDLFVGDVVHLFDVNRGYIGKKFVVKGEDDDKAFVMGIKGCCMMTIDGKLGLGYTIRRYKSHTQVGEGEEYAGIRMVTEQ